MFPDAEFDIVISLKEMDNYCISDKKDCVNTLIENKFSPHCSIDF